MHSQVVGVGELANGGDVLDRPDGAAAAVVGVLDDDEALAGEVDGARLEDFGDLLGGEDASPAVDEAVTAAAQRGGAPHS